MIVQTSFYRFRFGQMRFDHRDEMTLPVLWMCDHLTTTRFDKIDP